MWRLWTPGWGPRDWWYWFRTEGFPFWVARHLPPRVTLWAFIQVHALSGGYPNGFDEAYKLWASTHGIND